MSSKEITLTWGKLWIGFPPTKWLVNSDASREKIIKAEKLYGSEETILCLRLFFPRLNMSEGILGLTYRRSREDKLILKVPIVKEHENDSYVGLTKQYADWVLKEAELVLNSLSNVTSGELDFNYGQRHPAYSNVFIFRLLTRILISILNIEPDRINRNMVDEIVVINLKHIHSHR